MTWKRRVGAEAIWVRPALAAKVCMDDAYEILEHRHYAGSNRPCFGYTKNDPDPAEWPVVTATTSLPHGRYDLQRDLSAKLRTLLDEFAEEKIKA